MKVIGYQNPLCLMGIDYEDETAEIEQRIKAICGELDPEEAADLREQRKEMIRDRRKKATDAAQEILRKHNRGSDISRRGRIYAMGFGCWRR